MVLAAVLLAASSIARPAPVGLWHARLLPTPDHPVEFELLVEARGGALSGALVNGPAKVPFTAVSWDGWALPLELAHYDGRLVAMRRGSDLEGSYSRVTSTGLSQIAFAASRAARPLPKPAAARSVAGTWGIELFEGKTPTKLEGIFH